VRFLLDTNVVSEWTRPRPELRVIRWLDGADEDRVYLSVISVAEIRQGIERVTQPGRRERLQAWLDELAIRFEGRVLGVDWRIAEAWGVLVARGFKSGKPISVMDAFLAATATTHDLTLVTRNTADFATLGIPLFDPWTEG
jgi:toxin FitB